MRRDFAVIEVTWPKDSAIPVAIAQPSSPRTDQTASTVKPAPAAPLPAKTPAAFVTELTMDAGLRRIWRRYAEPELRAIAGAKVGNSATVLRRRSGAGRV